MSEDRPRTLLVRTAGTNCDVELARAFELAGSRVDVVHERVLVGDPARLDGYHLIAFPGGFAHGDDIAAGRVLSVVVRERLYERLHAAVERGACVLGVCNGFQVLVQVGLLPGPLEGPFVTASEPGAAVVALAANADDRFIDAWPRVAANPEANCVWTAPLLDRGADEPELSLPVAHGEGRLVTPERSTVDRIVALKRDALRYVDNVNGSVGDIAGLTDHTGRVFGLMPHPERFLSWRHHPGFGGLSAGVRGRETPGLAMFRSAVRAAALAPVG